MNGILKVLAGALVLQMAVTAAVTLDFKPGTDSMASGPLLAFDSNRLNHIRLQGDGNELELRQVDGRWVLPKHNNFPVNEAQVNALLDKLTAMQREIPVATSREARERFQVDEQNYQRHLQLFAGDNRLASVFLGTSTGRGMSHVRVEAEDSIHSVRLASFDMPLVANSWEDKTLLQFARPAIQKIELEDLILLPAKDDSDAAWEAAEGLADTESLDSAVADRLVGALASLRFERQVSQTEVETVAVDNDTTLAFSITLRDTPEPRRYELNQISGEEGWLLRVSDKPWVFRLGQWSGQNIRDNALRSALIKPAEVDVPEDGTEPDKRQEATASS